MTKRMSFALGLTLVAVGVGVAADKSDREAGIQTLTLPGKSWSLLVDLPGFKRDDQGTRPDGSGTMIQASSKKTDLVASVFLESRPDLDSTEACKADYWGKASKSPLPKSEVQHVTVGSMAAVHWLVPEYQGLPLMQRNVNAYLYRDGVCIDVHLSKVQYEPKDEALFTAVLTSVRFSDQLGTRAASPLEAHVTIANGRVVNTDAPYSFVLPQNWKLEGSSKPEAVSILQEETGSLCRLLMKPSDEDVESEFKALKLAVPFLGGKWSKVSERSVRLGGRRAVELVSTRTYPEQRPLRLRHVVAVRKRIAYILECEVSGTRSTVDRQVDELLEGFRWE